MMIAIVVEVSLGCTAADTPSPAAAAGYSRMLLCTVTTEGPDIIILFGAVGANEGRVLATVHVGNVALEGGTGCKIGRTQGTGECLEPQVDGATVGDKMGFLTKAAKAAVRVTRERPKVLMRGQVALRWTLRSESCRR